MPNIPVEITTGCYTQHRQRRPPRPINLYLADPDRRHIKHDKRRDNLGSIPSRLSTNTTPPE
eukprot:7899065-Pyramimonas_sp.AAC.1